MRDISEHIGKKYGRLLIVSILDTRGKHGHILVSCKCDCGNSHTAILTHLTKGGTTSCGCFNKDNQRKRLTKHGFAGTQLLQCWSDMKQRCLNPDRDNYKDYGGRGITIYQEWISDSTSFIKWALENGYQPGLQLDRKDNNGSYNPDNCRFVTNKINSRNTRKINLYTYNEASKTLGEWAEVFNVTKELIRGRLRRGWSFQDAIKPLINVA